MAHSPLLAHTLQFHAELTQAHEEAARMSALLNKHLSRAFELDLAETQNQAISIGSALQRVARAERASRNGVNHTFSKTYDEMLRHDRLALIDFDRLSLELETNLSPRCSEVAALAADIERHLNLAEQAHERAFGLVSLTDKQLNE